MGKSRLITGELELSKLPSLINFFEGQLGCRPSQRRQIELSMYRLWPRVAKSGRPWPNPGHPWPRGSQDLAAVTGG